MGVPLIRTRVYWALHWDPFILRNYQMLGFDFVGFSNVFIVMSGLGGLGFTVAAAGYDSLQYGLHGQRDHHHSPGHAG